MVYMNKKIILGIIITVVVIGGGFVVYEAFKPGSFCCPPEKSEEDQEETKESVLEAETQDWKTYRNEEYGFEFKYPKDWTADDTSKGAGFATFEYSVYPPCDSSECDDRGPLIQIALLKLNFSEYIENENFSNKSMYTLGNKTGFVIDFMGQSKIYAFEKDGKAFTIIIGITNDTEGKGINKKVNQIFSTFEFTK